MGKYYFHDILIKSDTKTSINNDAISTHIGVFFINNMDEI